MSNHLQENESFGEKSEVFYHLLLYAYLSCRSCYVHTL